MYIYAIIDKVTREAYVGQAVGNYSVGDFGRLASGVRLCDHFSNLYRDGSGNGKENSKFDAFLRKHSFKDLTVYVYSQGSGDSPYGIPADVYQNFLSFFTPANKAARSTKVVNYEVKLTVNQKGQSEFVTTPQVIQKAQKNNKTAIQNGISELDLLDIAEILYTANFLSQGYAPLAVTMGGQNLGWYYTGSKSDTMAFSRNTSPQEGLKILKFTQKKDAKLQEKIDSIITSAIQKVQWNKVWSNLPQETLKAPKELHEKVYTTLITAIMKDSAMQAANQKIQALLSKNKKVTVSSQSILKAGAVTDPLYQFLGTLLKQNWNKKGALKFQQGKGNIISLPINLTFNLEDRTRTQTWWKTSIQKGYLIPTREKFQAMQTIFVRMLHKTESIKTPPVTGQGVATVGKKRRTLYNLKDLKTRVENAKKKKPPRTLKVKDLYFIADKTFTLSKRLQWEFLSHVKFNFVKNLPKWCLFYNTMWYHLNKGSWKEIYRISNDPEHRLRKKDRSGDSIVTNVNFQPMVYDGMKGIIAYHYNLAFIKDGDLKQMLYY